MRRTFVTGTPRQALDRAVNDRFRRDQCCTTVRTAVPTVNRSL
ncbi:hypothetical protein HDC31_002837 [Microbacterium sp. JAI119]|nr:hypothetical protein [Microbacterium sp. JAI119]